MTSIPTGTTTPSCAATGGGPRPTRPPTCCPTSGRGWISSTLVAAPGPSPSTWPAGWRRVGPSAPAGLVEFATGDVYALDLPTDCFDVVHAQQVLQHLSDPVAALAEWRRVLRPGGWLAVRDSDYAGFVWAPHD